MIRVLRPGDEEALEQFLLPRIDSSLFLVGNQRKGGFEDNGLPLQGTYVAAWEDDSIVAVAAMFWNGNIILQASCDQEAILHALVAACPREVRGLLGPLEQTNTARQYFVWEEGDIQMDGKELLYSLDLEKLKVPQGLQNGSLRGRRAEDQDKETLVKWRVAYCLETLGKTLSKSLEQECQELIARCLATNSLWVVERGDELVSMSAFNTSIREAVQIGGVWTPPEYRGQGLARAAVATSLLDARADGVARSILFTGEHNIPAQRAYEGLGYQVIGDYCLLLFQRAIALRS